MKIDKRPKAGRLRQPGASLTQTVVMLLEESGALLIIFDGALNQARAAMVHPWLLLLFSSDALAGSRTPSSIVIRVEGVDGGEVLGEFLRERVAETYPGANIAPSETPSAGDFLVHVEAAAEARFTIRLEEAGTLVTRRFVSPTESLPIEVWRSVKWSLARARLGSARPTQLRADRPRTVIRPASVERDAPREYTRTVGADTHASIFALGGVVQNRLGLGSAVAFGSRVDFELAGLPLLAGGAIALVELSPHDSLRVE